MEAEVVNLLAPLEEGAVVVDGWRLDGIYISAWIYLRFRRGDGLAELALYPTPYVPTPACVAGGLAVVADDSARKIRGLTTAVCEALEGDDGEALFERSVRGAVKGRAATSSLASGPEAPRRDKVRGGAGAATPGPGSLGSEPRDPGPWLARVAVSGVAALAAFALWLLTLAGLGALVLTRREGSERGPSWERLSLAGALATAALLRLVVPALTVFKEAYPFRGFRAISAGFPGMDNPAELGLPIVQHAIASGLLWFAPGLYPDEAFAYLNLGMAILSPLLLFLAVRAWGGEARAALFAAWLLALLPLHIKYSGSEALTIASQAYLAGALLALGVFARAAKSQTRQRLVALLGLWVAAWLLFLVRPENPVLAPLFPLAAFALTPGGLRARATSLFWTSVAIGVAVLPALLLLLGGGGAGAEPPSLAVLHHVLPPHNVFLNLDFTPLVVPLAAGLGALVLLYGSFTKAGRTRGDLACLILSLGGLLLLYPVYAAIVSDVIPFGESRYQVNLSIFWLVPGAMGLAWTLSAAGLQRKPGLQALLFHALVALIAANAALYLAYVRDASYNPQQELAFFREELRPRLARGDGLGDCTVWLSPRDERSYKDEEGDQFVELFASPRAGIPGSGDRYSAGGDRMERDRLIVADLRSLPVVMESGPRCALFFRNLFCYRAHDPGLAENPQCRRILGSPGVTPIVERVVSNRPYHRERAPLLGERDSLTFGLYRVPLPLGLSQERDQEPGPGTPTPPLGSAR